MTDIPIKYLDDRTGVEKAIEIFNKIKDNALIIRRFALDNDMPALACSTDTVAGGAHDTVNVLLDIKELLYPPTFGNVIKVDFERKEVIK